jgi:hypothetical protein
MLMYSPRYEGFYGSIERAGKSSIQTLFYHFMGFPIWPQDSYLVHSPSMFSNDFQVREIKRNMKSIIAGYLRGWATMSSLALLFVGVLFAFLKGAQAFDGDPMPYDRSILAPLGIVGGVLGIGVAIVVWFITRHALSPVELSKRVVYQRHVGSPIDPAYLDDPWSLRDDIKRNLARIGEAAGMGASTQLFDRWPETILSPALNRPDMLGAALALTRLCIAAPEKEAPRDPAMLAQLHEQIWARLVQADPSILAARP